MKRLLYIIPVICSLLFVGQAKAETYTYDYQLGTSDEPYNTDSFYNSVKKNRGYFSNLYKRLFDEYNSKYKNDYPYYSLRVNSSNEFATLVLYLFKEPVYIKYGSDFFTTYTVSNNTKIGENDLSVRISGYYDFNLKQYIMYTTPKNIDPFYSLFGVSDFRASDYISSNFDIPVILPNDDDSINLINYKNTGSNYYINSGDYIPTVYDDNFIDSLYDYKEVNLNDYAYVAISLKDYNQEPFDTHFKVKGQFCATPVFNYGMTPKDSVTNNKVTDRCSLYYDDFTSVRFFVLDSDLKNHSIYYLKSYDTSKENIVKIDTKIFDISYITEEDKDNPYVTVNGKKYPTIPYDDLPSTATKNEEENFIPGQSEEFSFSDIFTKPLDFLKDVWESISSVFDLIAELFSLLPEPIKTFLIISFTLAVVLGLIKIIL